MQYAVKANQVFVIEANPRASRTVPFVAKATGVPLVKVAARTMVGATLAELRDEGLLCPPSPGGYVAVKEAVLPFNRFPEADTRARSGDAQHRRGDGHRHHVRPGLRQEPAGGRRRAAHRRHACSCRWPTATRPVGVEAARRFVDAGFTIAATAGTADVARGARASRSTPGWPRSATRSGTDAVELISSGKVDLVVNSPRGRGARADGAHIRAAAAVQGIPCLTTAAAGLAAANGIVDRAASRDAGAHAAGVPRGDRRDRERR